MKIPIALVAAIASSVVLGPFAQSPDQAAAVLQGLDAKKDAYSSVAKQIWDFAEVGFQEQKSSALLQQQLTSAGFSVEKGVADMPTGFLATWGAGKPVIAVIGEFDALPGLSQAAGEPGRRPLVDGAPGHGCGHNLFGTASLAAAVAVKEWMQANRIQGTLRYYGTPAEEGGGGKVYMIRAGLFRDVDVAVSWHPGDANDASPSSSLAMITARFKYHGIASHAAAAPEKGRSALDGLESMDYMVNMMREHVPQETRIHYVIFKGGVAANIVPDYAEAEYTARHPDMRVLQGIWERIVAASRGAAMGTGTTVDHEIISSYWNVLPSDTLAEVAEKNLRRVGGFDYTPEERAFAEKLRATVIGPANPIGSQKEVQPSRYSVGVASTDMGDISWNVPTVQMRAATFVPGVPAHSWQAVACTGMSIGFKGMMVAAKTLALTTMDLYTTPSTIAKAREEFLKKRGPDFAYTTFVGDRKPPLDFRK
jgi:aminobenzoyl-glutamate utilization protein B